MKSNLTCSEKLLLFTKTKPKIRKVRDGYSYIFTDIIAINTEKEITLKTTQSLMKQSIDSCKTLNYKVMEDK